MIDFLFGALAAYGSVYLYHHFKGESPQKIVSDLQQWRTELSQLGDDIAAKIAALPAEIEAQFSAKIADVQAQLDAEKADHAADLQKASDAVAAATPVPPAA